MTDLKKELLRFKNIVDGMTDKGDIKLELLKLDQTQQSTYSQRQYAGFLLKLSILSSVLSDSKKGINAILELAEELEKDK